MKTAFLPLALFAFLLALSPQQAHAQGNESNDTPAEGRSERHRGDLVPIEYRHRGDLVPIEYKSRGNEPTKERSFAPNPFAKEPSDSTQLENEASELKAVQQASILSLEKVQRSNEKADAQLRNLSLAGTRIVVLFKPGVTLQQGTDALQKLITQGALILDDDFFDTQSAQYGIVLKCTNLDYALPAVQAIFDEHEVQRVQLKDMLQKASGQKNKKDK